MQSYPFLSEFEFELVCKAFLNYVTKSTHSWDSIFWRDEVVFTCCIPDLRLTGTGRVRGLAHKAKSTTASYRVC